MLERFGAGPSAHQDDAAGFNAQIAQRLQAICQGTGDSFNGGARQVLPREVRQGYPVQRTCGVGKVRGPFPFKVGHQAQPAGTVRCCQRQPGQFRKVHGQQRCGGVQDPGGIKRGG